MVAHTAPVTALAVATLSAIGSFSTGSPNYITSLAWLVLTFGWRRSWPRGARRWCCWRRQRQPLLPTSPAWTTGS
jgi:hypothetical protein